jgi:uncharacterized protein
LVDDGAGEDAQVELARQLAALADAAVAAFAGTSVFVAYAYGSRLWGVARPDSDLDVGYYTLPLADGLGLPVPTELRLADLLAEAAGVEVDLRCLANAPLGLRGRALVEGRRVYSCDEVARVNLERDLLSRYLDYKPKLEAMRELRFAALAERAR